MKPFFVAVTCALFAWSAYAEAGIAPMKLLSPSTGWVTSGNRLYWTNDAGDDWQDITPVPAGL